MKAKMLLVCAALALGLLSCDSASEGDSDGHGDTDAHDHDDTDDHDHDHDDEAELITTVMLTFTPEMGTVVTASFSDPDGDGGASGTAEPINLAADTTYTLTISLLNDLEDEDITEEIREEAEEHQFIIYGPSVTGPGSMGDGLVTHAYADLESDYTQNATGDDLPVGIANTIITEAAGSGEFSVMLRHLPEVNGNPQKEAGLAEEFGAGGSPAGDTDVDVSFELNVG